MMRKSKKPVPGKFTEGTTYDRKFPKPNKDDIEAVHFVTAFRVIQALERGTTLSELVSILGVSKGKATMYLKLVDLHVYPIIYDMYKGVRVYRFEQKEFFQDL